jgi:Cof subfamily protein (haloacid dehalogenase superfamily)
VNAVPSVVATDLDGTIVRSDGTISARTRDALALAAGANATVVIVTGRPPRWMHDIAEQTGHRGLAVCANGALVYDLHRETILDAHPLGVDVARDLVQSLRTAIPGLGFAVETVDSEFGHEPGYRPRWATDGALVADMETLLSRPLAKLLARHEGLDSDELLARARAVIDEATATMTHSSRDGLLEISAAGISKATTLADVVAGTGHDATDVVAFGDMPNDLPMLAWAGHSVAVANAHPDVLDVVDEVTASNDDDGVAVVLERIYAVTE